MEDVRCKCKQLELAVEVIKRNVDLKNQEIHNYDRELTMTKALNQEYKEEIEYLRKELSRKQDLEKEIQQLMKSLENIKHCRHDELLQKSADIDSLKTQIKKRKHEVEVKSTEPSNSTHEESEKERESLLYHIRKLKAELLSSQSNYESAESDNIELKETQPVFLKKLNDLKCTLKSNNAEIVKIQSLVKDIQKQIFDTKVQLDSLKCKPLDPSKRGNSMFGEVEDSCVKLQQNMQKMKMYYSTVEREIKEDMIEMNRLIQQNELQKQNFVDLTTYDNEYEVELLNMTSSFPILESKIEEYKNYIREDCRFILDVNVEYLNCKIKSLWEDVIKAGDELNIESGNLLKAFKALEDVNKSVREKKKSNLFLQCRVGELEFTLMSLRKYSSN